MCGSWAEYCREDHAGVISMGYTSELRMTAAAASCDCDGQLAQGSVGEIRKCLRNYALTSAGETLSTAVGSLIDWAEQHRAYIDASRHRYDEDQG